MPQTSFRLGRVASAYLAGQSGHSVDETALAPILALPADSVASVLGAPGSGKTFAVSAWFKNAVAGGRHPDSILVLSANRTSATLLRDQLALELQTATGGALARSVNSFAFGLLQAAALRTGKKLPQLISGSEQDRILTELLEQLDPATAPDSISALTLELAGFRSEVRDLFAVIQEHQLSTQKLRALALQFGKPAWSFAADLFEKYETVLAGEDFEQRFDASTLLHRAAALLVEEPSLIDDIDVILVDDSQELTPAALNLIRVAVETRYSVEAKKTSARGLFLFGDPDASTLGFRAADPQAMVMLAREVAQLRGQNLISLTIEPNRQVRPAALSSLMARISASIDPALAGTQRRSLATAGEATESQESSNPIETVVLRDRVSEISWIARRLRELHLYEGVAWADIAVVARSRQELAKLETALAGESVPTQVAGAQTALRDEFASRALLILAQAVVSKEPMTLELANELLSSPFAGLDSLSMRRLRRVLRRQEIDAEGTRNSDELILDLFSAPGSAATLENPEGRKANRFIKTFFEAKQLAENPNLNIEDLLWKLFSSSKVGTEWQSLSRGIGEVALQANRNLDAIASLFAAANRYIERTPNAPAAAFIENQLSLGLPEDSLAVTDRTRETVLLLTPSGLIGRRFKVVCLPSLIEGAWPNLRPRSSLLSANVLDALLKGHISEPTNFLKSELPDELRLLHKAVGATTEKLIVSSYISEEQQVSQFVTLIAGKVPATTSFEGNSLTLRALSGQLRRDLAQTFDGNRPAEENPGGAGLDPTSYRQSLTMGIAKLAAAGVAGAHPDSWYGLAELSSTAPLFDPADPNASVYLRPSDIDNFLKCPLHWFIESHGGNSSTFEANLGSILHKAVELATEIDETSFWNTIETQWHSLTFEADWVEQIEKRKARKMAQNALEYLANFADSGGVVLGREVPFSFKAGNATISGKVDRIEQLADGRVMIVDLKTGTFQTDAKHTKEHPQLLMYQLAYENGQFDENLKFHGLPETIRAMGEGKIVRPELAGAQLWVIADKNKVTPQDSIETNAELRALVDEILQDTTEGMASNAFIAQLGSHCENSEANKYSSCSIHLVRPVSYVA
jgi:superfamily I DNA/RNA helicase/RecB family exonuclease